MSKRFRPPARGWARPSACLAATFLVFVALHATACTGARSPRGSATVELPHGWTGQIAWRMPEAAGELASLARWRDAVGNPVTRQQPAVPAAGADRITVVSWNVANGLGDVTGLVETFDAGEPLILLLQETYRRGATVPIGLHPAASFAGRLGGMRVFGDDTDVESLADTLGLSLFYVPSMRNGGATSDEDRGNAILSNLPLTDLQAIELPFERQRRVAVAATVTGLDAGGEGWRLRVASVHLDSLSSRRTIWLGGEFTRARQARAVREAVASHEAVVLGGDFNTWFAFAEPAFVETFVDFPDTTLTDRRATFGGLLRLDHLFFRLHDGWRATFGRADDTYGSDHHPLVGTIRLR